MSIARPMRILDEWEGVIVRERKRTPEQAARITSAIRDFFDDCKVDRAEYEALVDEMPGPDVDDHEHIAVGIWLGVVAYNAWA